MQHVHRWFSMLYLRANFRATSSHTTKPLQWSRCESIICHFSVWQQILIRFPLYSVYYIDSILWHIPCIWGMAINQKQPICIRSQLIWVKVWSRCCLFFSLQLNITKSVLLFHYHPKPESHERNKMTSNQFILLFCFYTLYSIYCRLQFEFVIGIN